VLGVKWFAVSVVIGVLVLAFAAAGDASFPGSNGDLYFTGYAEPDGPPNHLYSIHPDGTGLTQLTSGATSDLAVRIAPGGGPAIVSADTQEQCGHLYWAQGVDLFTVPRDGGTSTRLTDDCPVSESSPTWSPSGNHIVFSRFGNLWSMRADGTGLAELTCDATESDYMPDWAPDGSHIAFDRSGAILVMDADGDNAHPLTNGWNPSYAPDGTHLAYAGQAPGSAQGIYVIGADGTDARQLTSGYDLDPVWSPDGTKIAFIHVASIDVPQSFVIETMKSDGTDQTVVMSSLNASSLDWASNTSATGAHEPDVTAPSTACVETTLPAPTQPSPPAGSPPVVITPPTGDLAASSVAAPDRLVVGRVVFGPQLLHTRRPFRIAVTVRDLGGRGVVGALVQGVPLLGYARVTATRVTGKTGVVGLRVAPTKKLPLGRRLVLTVRARRPGDAWSSRASAHRLVSVRTAHG
jgi:dipeptidyl aminopeptidase/acylaminoacyl peptidase